MNSACLYRIPYEWAAINTTIVEQQEDLQHDKQDTTISLLKTEKWQKVATVIALGLAVGLTLAMYGKGQGSENFIEQTVCMFGAMPVGIGLGGLAIGIHHGFAKRIERLEIRLNQQKQGLKLGKKSVTILANPGVKNNYSIIVREITAVTTWICRPNIHDLVECVYLKWYARNAIHVMDAADAGILEQDEKRDNELDVKEMDEKDERSLFPKDDNTNLSSDQAKPAKTIAARRENPRIAELIYKLGSHHRTCNKHQKCKKGPWSEPPGRTKRKF